MTTKALEALDRIAAKAVVAIKDKTHDREFKAINDDVSIIRQALQQEKPWTTEQALGAFKVIEDKLPGYQNAKDIVRQALQTDWMPIESAPRDGTLIILFGLSKHANFECVGFGHWFKTEERFAWDGCLGADPNPPTHWQHLPAPPKED